MTVRSRGSTSRPGARTSGAKATLNTLSAAAAAKAIARGEITSEALVRACLERIEAREASVRAWAHLDPKQAIAEAKARDRELEAGKPRGALHGVSVGVQFSGARWRDRRLLEVAQWMMGLQRG